MNVNVTFGQGDSDFPVKAGATDNGMDVDFGNTQLIKGDKGDKGDPGEKGDKGDPGADGISPTVAVQDITGGHRVTITDKDGAKTFDVMDGAGGSGGAAVQSDLSVNDESDPAYVKNRTHWLERPYEPIVWDGSTEGRDSVDVSLAFGYPAGSVVAYKISDHVLTKEEIGKSRVSAVVNNGTTGTGTIHSLVDFVPETLWAYDIDVKDSVGYDLIVTKGISTTIAGDFSSSLGVNIPSVGTYCLPMKIDASIQIDADAYHIIDDRYLPADIAKTNQLNAYYTKQEIDNANASFARRKRTPTNAVIVGLLNGQLVDNAFSEDETIKDLVIPSSITSVGKAAFSSANIETVVFNPSGRAISLSYFMFLSCPYLKTAVFGIGVGRIETSSFSNCPALHTVRFKGSLASGIYNRAFELCASLKALIIENREASMPPPLMDVDVFLSTPISSGTGYIYVPRALVDSYKVEKNWSTYASQFRALEDYTVDGTITGDLDESKI